MATASTRFVEILCAVVEQGGFTAAARQLGLTPAAVSRAVSRHEAAFDVRLFHRTTRSVTPTHAGQAFYERCRRALSLLDEAERELAMQREQPRGVVRLSAPTTYGHYRLAPVLAAFARRFPRVSLEVNISNENVDFVLEKTDLAVRRGVLRDSSLVARKLEDATVGVFASPGYLARHPEPAHPDDLADHTCIPFTLPSTGRPVPWGFLAPDGAAFHRVPPDRVHCSGDPLACIRLARYGAGLVQTYHFLVEEELRQGHLVEVLRGFSGRSSPFTLIRPSRQGQPVAVQVLADMIVEHCARPAGP